MEEFEIKFLEVDVQILQNIFFLLEYKHAYLSG
jgi:hypothetical protein